MKISQNIKRSMVYDEDALQKVREDRLLIDRCDKWLFEEIEPYLGQRVLEIGCGLGNFARLLQDRELYMGMDICIESVNVLKTRFYNVPNLDFKYQDITDSSVLRLSDYCFDTLISINVIEHIEDDLLVFKHCYQLLNPNGHLVIIVPAHPFIYGSMDQAIGHYRRYTKTDLKMKLMASGFNIKEQRYINMLGAVGWCINSRILNQAVPPRGQLKIMNTIVPVSQKVEQIIDAPFGVSLMTVASPHEKKV